MGNPVLQPQFTQNYDFHRFHRSLAIHADCFAWMRSIPAESIHAVVTDPPYGVKEYDFDQLDKRANGNGGIWRIPPAFDGNQRAPLPRFTALSQEERERVYTYFNEWGETVLRVLRPGGHLFLASNSFLSQIVFASITEAGFEFRGQIIRTVRTLRGGDRPKKRGRRIPRRLLYAARRLRAVGAFSQAAAQRDAGQRLSQSIPDWWSTSQTRRQPLRGYHPERTHATS